MININNKKRQILVICIAVFIICGTLLSVYVADSRARKSAVARAEAVLLDSAREQAHTFSAMLEGKLEVLESLSAGVSLYAGDNASHISAVLTAANKSASLGFSSISLLLSDGYNAADSELIPSVSHRDYFKAAMGGADAMERIEGLVSGRVALVLAVPYRSGGEITGVIRGIFYEEDLRNLLTSQAYGGSGYSFLVCSHGDVVVNAEVDAHVIENYNILSALESATFTESSLEQLTSDLAAGRSGTYHYTLAGVNSIAVLVPLRGALLPENDWYVLNIVNDDSFESEITASRRDSIEALEILSLFALTSLGMFVLLAIDYRREKLDGAELMRQREEQFRIVARQSGKFVLRYDIPTKTILRSDTDSDGFGGTEVYHNGAEGVIASGLIDPADADAYRDFFARVDSGESPVESTFLMNKLSGERRWIKHVSTTIRSKKGKPATAIISYFDNTEQREREIAYSKWQQELESLSLENAALYEFNLTKDYPEGRRGPLSVDYVGAVQNTFDGRSAMFAKAHVHEDDRAEYNAMMNREHLIVMYASGVYRGSLDYRYLDSDGSMRWRRLSVQLVPYPDSQDIKIYVTNRDIDADKREELEIIERAEQDSLTGVFNRETFIRRVSSLIACAAPEAFLALLMLDIDGFKGINDSLGHEAGDRTLVQFVSHIRTVLRSSDVVGRIGGDEFMVCLPDMPSESAITSMARRLCRALNWQLDSEHEISASIGVALFPRDGADFDELYKKADTALYHVKEHGKNSFAFFGEGDMGD